MGTTYRVTYASPAVAVEDVSVMVDALLEDINASLSTYIETSLISRINSGGPSIWHEIDDHFAIVFDEARLLHEDTEGTFNPAVGPLVEAWGFGPAGAVSLPDDRTIRLLLELVDFRAFERQASPPAVRKTRDGAQLDFSAIAKGYGVDAVGELLESRSIESYLVEIGGEVRTRGMHPDGRPWSVGIERPSEDPSDRGTHAVVLVHDAALATSGNYRNYIERDGRRYAHILNPGTGYPEESSLFSVSVLAADCMTADAYATAFMVMGQDRAIDFVESRVGLEAYFISGEDTGGYVELRSTGFPAPE